MYCYFRAKFLSERQFVLMRKIISFDILTPRNLIDFCRQLVEYLGR